MQRAKLRKICQSEDDKGHTFIIEIVAAKVKVLKRRIVGQSFATCVQTFCASVIAVLVKMDEIA
jgi:hypothetical protein